MKILILTIAVVTLSGCDQPSFAQATDPEIVMAIYHAEGGPAAQYPFGIRSVSCATFTNCQRICQTTIRHNRSRFAHIRNKGHQSYLEYLANRYCPSKGRNLTPAERRLNINWLRNVRKYLRRHYNE